MRQWVIRDSTSTMLDGFEISWLPTAAYQYVTPALRRLGSGGEAVWLEAGPYVGALPLKNGDALQIRPRAGERAFWRILTVAEGLDENMLPKFEDLTEFGFADQGKADWRTLLSRSFIKQLRHIEKQSLRTDRVKVRTRRYSAKGRILVAQTFAALKTKQESPVHCVYREKTYDTPDHRLLSSAARRLLELGMLNVEDRRIAIRWTRNAPSSFDRSDLERVLVQMRRGYYLGSRSYYVQGLVMARLILAHAGLNFDSEILVTSEAALTNMYTLFEGYIRALVSSTLRDKGFVVSKPVDRPLPFFQDGGISLIPDIVVADAERPRLIIDAKYKVDRNVEPADLYQLNTYMERYEVNIGALVSPISEGPAEATIRTTARLRRIVELKLPLNDWVQGEARLTAEVQRLLSVA